MFSQPITCEEGFLALIAGLKLRVEASVLEWKSLVNPGNNDESAENVPSLFRLIHITVSQRTDCSLNLEF